MLLDVTALQLAVAGIGAVGLVASAQTVTGWIRLLFGLRGNQVRIAATCVASYLVICFGLTQTTWKVGGVDVAGGAAWLGVSLYLVAVIASAAAAWVDQLGTEVEVKEPVDVPAEEVA